MFAKYANRTDDQELIPEPASKEPIQYVAPAPMPERKPQDLRAAAWPFDAAEATKRLTATKLPTTLKIELADGKALDMALIPAGEFIMGNAAGETDELPVSKVTIDKPFYMGAMEISNAQYAAFDTKHDSGVISQTGKDQGDRGVPINQPNQPVVRVTWNEALAFCNWLSQKTGRKFTLPTEAQWEWACRAGTETPFFYGNRDADFAKFANLADASLGQLDRGDAPPWHPRDRRFNDGCGVTSEVGRYEPNAWGLRNMIGNAAEWTLSTYQPYPYLESDGRNDLKADTMKTVRGGSWYNRPIHTGSAARLPYRPWQAVYNVGFRVVMSAEGQPAITATGAGQVPASVSAR
jgi:formylglycine-generating enzyme required for sulfatase activity